MSYDYLIIGAGFAGSTTARVLAEKGFKVLIIERRNHIGGNSFDYFDTNGVLIHKYGPHYFRTNSEEVFAFLSRFTAWRNWEYIVKACVNDKLYDLPINLNTINKFFNKNFSSEEAQKFIENKKVKIKNPQNAEEQVVSQIGYEIYDNFFKEYTTKQWGIPPHELDKSVTARIPIRFNTDPRYFTDKYQCMPASGYFKLFENLLDHKNIEVKLNEDFSKNKQKYDSKTLVYTGCIDEYYNYIYNKLPYRSLKFEIERLNQEFYQDYSQINYPNNFEYTRIVEIKHATGQKINKTTIIKEYPSAKGDPYYPIPNPKNELHYLKYKELAEKEKNVFFIGRLAQYKYLNMDQVVLNTLNTFSGK